MPIRQAVGFGEATHEADNGTHATDHWIGLSSVAV